MCVLATGCIGGHVFHSITARAARHSPSGKRRFTIDMDDKGVVEDLEIKVVMELTPWKALPTRWLSPLEQVSNGLSPSLACIMSEEVHGEDTIPNVVAKAAFWDMNKFQLIALPVRSVTFKVSPRTPRCSR